MASEEGGYQRLAAQRQRLDREHGLLSGKLWHFAEPFLHAADNPLDVQQTFALAVAAWNLPFIDFDLRSRIVEEAADDEVRLLLQMYVRRLRVFAHDPRMVLEHRLLELGRDEYVPVLVWAVGELTALPDD